MFNEAYGPNPNNALKVKKLMRIKIETIKLLTYLTNLFGVIKYRMPEIINKSHIYRDMLVKSE